MKVFNTLSGKKEEFVPQGDEVKMYVCGVTPYDDAHLGHAMSYIIFDVIRRYLKYRKYNVKYVQNVTDIDDKIIDRANQRGISTSELADRYITGFKEEMEKLNVLAPDETPYATGEIENMKNVISGLVDKGYAYPAKGSVYFRVRNVPDYGKLSHRSLDSMRAGDSCELGEEKEDPLDFVLWKASKPGEPSWESPWGEGRPGWHIECSAMSLKYLGETIDIHGGGRDLIFPHHENEIAQSESFTGKKPFVKYWLHNGMVQLGEEKMSKSLGNLITIKEALERYSADALRIFVLSSHYRSPLTYSEEAIEAAKGGVERLLRVISRDEPSGNKGEALDAEPYRKQFIEAMDDDFNTAQAVATLFDLAREINRADETGLNVSQAHEVLRELAGLLGLTLKEPEIIPVTINLAPKLVETSNELIKLTMSALKDDKRVGEIATTIGAANTQIEPFFNSSDMSRENMLSFSKAVDSNIGGTIELREILRKAKQFQFADEIRNKLGELGIALEDTPTGTVWKRKR
jgi:cysteinyl-tRNA synthetase